MITAAEMRAESRMAAKIDSPATELDRIMVLMKKQAKIGDNHCCISINRIELQTNT